MGGATPKNKWPRQRGVRELIVEMIKEGGSNLEIAEELGVDRGAVQLVRNKIKRGELK